MRKTRLQYLYCLSFVESMDTLKAIDPDNAAVIRIFNEYEYPGEHIGEIAHRTGVSPYIIRTLVMIKAINDNGGNVIDFVGHTRSHMEVSDDLIIKMVDDGHSCSEVARKFGTHDLTIWKQLHFLGYGYNHRLNRWEKTNTTKPYNSDHSDDDAHRLTYPTFREPIFLCLFTVEMKKSAQLVKII